MFWAIVVAAALVLPGIAVAIALSRDVSVGPVLVAGAGFAAVEVLSLILLIVAGLSCDESCEDPPEVWSDDPDAWQWDAIAAGGFVSLGAGAVGLFALAYRRRRLAIAALVVLVVAQAVAWSLAM